MKAKQFITILILAAGLCPLCAQDEDTAQDEAAAAPETTLESADLQPEPTVAEASPKLVEAAPVVVPEIKPSAAAVVPEATIISNLFTGYIHALGGERAWLKVKSQVIKGTLEVRETNADFEIRQSKDGGFLSVKKMPGNTSRVGFDGKTAWTQAGDSPWTELSETDTSKEKFFGSLTGFLDWQTFYTRTRLLPGIEINGRPVKIVLAENDLGVSQKIYFDEQKARIVRVDEQIEYGERGRVTAETYYKDYRAVNDVVIPFIEESILPDATLTKRIRSVEQGIHIEPGLFSPPKAGQVASSGVRDTERFFNSLTIGGIAYTNVWVHRQTNFNVLIRHAQGIQTIKLTDLPKGDLDELRPQLGDLANIEMNRGFVVADQWGAIAGNVEMQQQVRERIKMATEILAYVLVPFLLGWLVAHLIGSYLIKRLCDRTHTKGGIAVWIPFVQLAPMFRAAGFSDKWLGSALTLLVSPGLVLLVAPMAGFEIEPTSVAMMMMIGFIVIGMLIISVATIMWPFKICSRCQKSPALGLLMFVPVVNVGVMVYLACSEES